MGIQGLLPLLKSIQRPTELKKFAGETLGVDGYGWLHRGAVACAIELAQGKPTRRYVDFAMNRVRMVKYFGVTPYLVFDGDFLPSKAATEDSRSKRREDSRKAGLELLKAGKPSQAHLELQKSIDVTPEMARVFIEELKKAGVPYVVAPYEADAQLVYLERKGHIGGILSEDSDLLVFGAKRLLTKLDQHGQCIEINRRDFCGVREISLTGWSDTEFRQMAILSGCDYLEGIGNMGLKTAYRMIRKHKNAERVIKMAQFDGKFRLSSDYWERFKQAESTFLYQRVFCPTAKALVCLTDPAPGVNLEEMPFIGAHVAPGLAQEVAAGNVNPITKQKIILQPSSEARKRAASSGIRAPNQPVNNAGTPSKSIASYFKGDRRIPLGEMDPNCFSVDPQRVATMTEEGQRPIVFPLPRPYVEDTTVDRSRSYLSRQTTSPRLPRRRTEPVANLLHDQGISSMSTSRRRTEGPANVLAVKDTNGASNPARPPKKARLCNDTESFAAPTKERSKFFPSKTSESLATNQPDGYLMSDDSIQEALMELPDVDGWHEPSKPSKEIFIFEEKSQPTQTEGASTKSQMKPPETPLGARHTGSRGRERPLSSIQAVFGDHSNEATGQSTATARSSKPHNTQYRRISTASVQTSTTVSTPTSSVASSVHSSAAKSTPATPFLTPLQRLGARAMNRTQQSSPSTSRFTFAAPRSTKRGSIASPQHKTLAANERTSYHSVDVKETCIAQNTGGSEDQLVPESSESEETVDSAEHDATDGEVRGTRKPDLSQFMYV